MNRISAVLGLSGACAHACVVGMVTSTLHTRCKWQMVSSCPHCCRQHLMAACHRQCLAEHRSSGHETGEDVMPLQAGLEVKMWCGLTPCSQRLAPGWGGLYGARALLGHPTEQSAVHGVPCAVASENLHTAPLHGRSV
jgi:hypothetical protein